MRIEKEVLDILVARLAHEIQQGVDNNVQVLITDALIERIRGEIVIEIKMRDNLGADLERISKELSKKFVRGVKQGQKCEPDTESTEEEVEEAVAAEEEPDGKDDTDDEGDEDGNYEDTEGGPEELYSDEELYNDDDDFVDALEGDGTVAAGSNTSNTSSAAGTGAASFGKHNYQRFVRGDPSLLIQLNEATIKFYSLMPILT